MVNIIGKQIKNDYTEEYQIRKIIESFFNMESIHKPNKELDKLGIQAMVAARESLDQPLNAIETQEVLKGVNLR